MRGLIGGLLPERWRRKAESEPTKKCRKRLLYYGSRVPDNLITPELEASEGVSRVENRFPWPSLGMPPRLEGCSWGCKNPSKRTSHFAANCVTEVIEAPSTPTSSVLVMHLACNHFIHHSIHHQDLSQELKMIFLPCFSRGRSTPSPSEAVPMLARTQPIWPSSRRSAVKI